MALSRDFFQVQEWDGVKFVWHQASFTGDGWMIEYTFSQTPIDGRTGAELLEDVLLHDERVQQYIENNIDIDEWNQMTASYYGGMDEMQELRIEDVTEDTPCGCYYYDPEN